MIKVALTGGIASGKTVFLNAVKGVTGVKTLQADELAKEIYHPDNPHFDEVVDVLGDDVLTDSGRVDLSRVSDQLFRNEKLLRKIENISHPYVKKRLDELSNQFDTEGARLLLVEIPLLFQSPEVDRDEFDHIILLSLNRKIQVERLMERDGVSRSRAKDRIKSQSLPEYAEKKANFVIRTDSSIEETEKKAKRTVKEILN